MAYIIAEIGNMHEGSLPLAKKTAEAARDCGVNCVKYQAHYFDEESLPNAPNPPYFKDESRKSYFDRTSFSLDEWRELRRYIEDELKLDFMCSPFSKYAIEILKTAGVRNFKIASGEVSNLPLLKELTKIEGCSIFLSSGMSNYEELNKATKVLQETKDSRLVLFQCTSEYPCKPKNVGLNVIEEFIKRYPKWEIGLSDHTLSTTAAILSLSKGAQVFEKHLTLSNLMYGSDAKNSLEPRLFKKYVDEIREAELVLKNRVDKDMAAEKMKEMKITFEKSIVFSRNLDKGSVLTDLDFNYKKPGNGISASRYEEFIGKMLKSDVSKDELLTTKLLIK